MIVTMKSSVTPIERITFRSPCFSGRERGNCTGRRKEDLNLKTLFLRPERKLLRSVPPQGSRTRACATMLSTPPDPPPHQGSLHRHLCLPLRPPPAPTPKLHSGAASHKLKKDIRRCHRMSRRPLPRPDPLAPPTSCSSSSRPPVSPFSETVRILNRKVKPREVKRGRIILNLKVIDKSGKASSPAALHHPPSQRGRPPIPSRNRIIGKKFSDGAYRGLQPPLKLPGFPMYGKPFGLQQVGPVPGQPPLGMRSGTGRSGSGTPAHTVSIPPRLSVASEGPGGVAALPVSQYQPPLSPSSSSGPDSTPASPTQIQLPPLPAPASVSPPRLSPQGLPGPEEAPGLQSNPSPVAFLPSCPSPSSSPSTSEDEEAILDQTTARATKRKSRGRPVRRRRRNKAAATTPVAGSSVSPGAREPYPNSSPPLLSPEAPRGAGEGDPNWRPEMAPCHANVVVTDVTTNLLTVTIKEFCLPPDLDMSSPASPTSPSSPPAAPSSPIPPVSQLKP
uniref:Chromobox homolog 6a n=1 Tax=Scleropages formosus TaxID=113540 RepID=A0A8C9WIE7_SCLFO